MELPQPFPRIPNTSCPSPASSSLWSPHLLSSPLPTNSAWQNFVLSDGSCPEYIHPYIVQSRAGSISLCYPPRVAQPAFVFQAFTPDLTIGVACPPTQASPRTHRVAAFDDLSVTLDLPGGLTLPLVRGSPFVTLAFRDWSAPALSTPHAVSHLASSPRHSKHRLTLDNGQTWLLYCSAPLPLSPALAFSGRFKGSIRVALLVGGDAGEAVLDAYSHTYPVQGHADLSIPFQVRYEWKTSGPGPLLMLSLPIHREMMSSSKEVKFVPGLSYTSIDGELVAVEGDCWVLREVPISVGWYSSRGVLRAHRREEVANALRNDVESLQQITNSSTYFFGKAVARAARLALIAEEISLHGVVGTVRDFLMEALTPWMEGSYPANALGYDSEWGGLISRNGAMDSGADFGLGVYNDHHYHLGYFSYAGAVLAKLDPSWGNAYKAHLYTIVGDYMTAHSPNTEQHPHHPSHLHRHVHHCHTASHSQPLFPRFRNFDFWVLHSWASGLTQFADGRNQESTSEAVNAYYSASLVGLAFGDPSLVSLGLTLAALEMRAARAFWHIPSSCTLYEPEFTAHNRIVGVLWANKRDTGLWFAPAEWKECRLGIQLLPILPITEVLFQDVGFVQELVEWTWPALCRSGVGDGWKGFVYSLQALYAPEEALENVLTLSDHDDGNSLSNLLWWIFSRWPTSEAN